MTTDTTPGAQLKAVADQVRRKRVTKAVLEAQRDEARMEYEDCWSEGDRLRAYLASAEARSTALEGALREAVTSLTIISEMSDATEQSSFREEAWTALDEIPSALLAPPTEEAPHE